jgi:hypothetical protein
MLTGMRDYYSREDNFKICRQTRGQPTWNKNTFLWTFETQFQTTWYITINFKIGADYKYMYLHNFLDDQIRY